MARSFLEPLSGFFCDLGQAQAVGVRLRRTVKSQGRSRPAHRFRRSASELGTL